MALVQQLGDLMWGAGRGRGRRGGGGGYVQLAAIWHWYLLLCVCMCFFFKFLSFYPFFSLVPTDGLVDETSIRNLMYSFNRGDIERTNSSKISV